MRMENKAIMNRQKIIDKICKCLRLSESCNPNEAASALRQAHGLMKKYDVTEDQILANDVSEAAVESISRYNPPYWVLALSNIVAQAFECRVFVSRRYGRRPEFRFIGMDISPEIASYTFNVLYRQLKQVKIVLKKIAVPIYLPRLGYSGWHTWSLNLSVPPGPRTKLTAISQRIMGIFLIWQRNPLALKLEITTIYSLV